MKMTCYLVQSIRLLRRSKGMEKAVKLSFIPIRLNKADQIGYANFEYVNKLCYNLLNEKSEKELFV